MHFPTNVFLFFYSQNGHAKLLILKELKSFDKLILFLFHLNRIRTDSPSLLLKDGIFNFLYQLINSTTLNYNHDLFKSFLNSLPKEEIRRLIKEYKIYLIDPILISLLNERLNFYKKENLKIEQDLEEFKKRN